MEIVHTRTIHAESIEVNSLLYPKTEPQIKLMKEILDESGLTPDSISFLEASGIAVKDIDTKELNAIGAVYKNRKKPLSIGSVKSIVGNTVSANTFVSIVKMIIASETGQIAPNLHYKTPNTMAQSLVEGQLTVLKELTPWNGLYSVVNTTSINGTVSNTILKASEVTKKNNGAPSDDLPRLVIVSGRTEEAIESLLDYMDAKPLDAEFLQLLYDIFQSEIDGHLYRGYSIVPAKGLVSEDSKKREYFFNSGEKKQVWWIFSGMGSQWVEMGRDLLRLPIFNTAIKKCDNVLRPQGYDVFKIITERNPKMFDQIINSFVGIAAIQIGLVDVLRAVGLEPDYIIGHSVGELGCAYADGCFTAEQMIMAALSRGLASTESKLEKGSMAAVGLGYADMKPLCPSDIDIACHNGPESSTISGPAESTKKFVASLT
ncbi:fatty acid synthase-like, partial [Copidosoma floridanum]|uniref:fatty acid synthase-like n=1 Tax=Copidosoma floridanum TaxID=29053 RepID=UPI0006C9C124